MLGDQPTVEQAKVALDFERVFSRPEHRLIIVVTCNVTLAVALACIQATGTRKI